eukprot:4533923-Amphidinium_carterae.1
MTTRGELYPPARTCLSLWTHGKGIVTRGGCLTSKFALLVVEANLIVLFCICDVLEFASMGLGRCGGLGCHIRSEYVS